MPKNNAKTNTDVGAGGSAAAIDVTADVAINTNTAAVVDVMLRCFLSARPFPGVSSVMQRVHRALRVDLAGEKGAEAIYAGQLWVLKDHPLTPLISEMAAQEAAHARAFEALLQTHHVRPSLLAPLWQAGGFLMGALTSLCGGNAAMACTAAVEEVIDTHYQEQVADLTSHDPELGSFLEQCRLEEVAHRQASLQSGADDAPLSRILQAAIRLCTRTAIAVAKRI